MTCYSDLQFFCRFLLSTHFHYVGIVVLSRRGMDHVHSRANESQM